MAILTESIDLGGIITLKGFNDTEPIKLIVVKKIIGKYTKELSEITPIGKLIVTLKSDKDEFIIKAETTSDEKEVVNEANTDNLFTAIDDCLKGLKSKLA